MNIKPWIMATRPKTLAASVGPVLLGSSIAYKEVGAISFAVMTLILITALLLQVGTNLVNDYYDSVRGIDDDNRLGPTRVTQAGILSPKSVKTGFVVVFIIAFILGLYLMNLGGAPIITIGLLSILFAYCYTGGPLPLSYMGLGEVLAFIFFGPIPVWGTTYLLNGNQSSMTAIIAGCGVGFISAALMSINNLRDIYTDSKTKKKTLAVLFGEKGARLMTILFVAASSFIPFYLGSKLDNHYIVTTTFTAYLFTSTWLHISRAPISAAMNECLARTGKYLFLYCIVMSLSIALV